MPTTDAGLDATSTPLDALRYLAANSPDRPYVRVGGTAYTYGAMLEVAEDLARGLRTAGVAAGDRVAVLTANRIEAVECFFGLSALGAINVPLNVYLKGEFLRYPLADCAASTLVLDRAGFDTVAPLLPQLPDVQRLVLLDPVEVEAKPETLDYLAVKQAGGESADILPMIGPDDVAGIFYTSGTTGPSKGCILQHGYFASVGRGTAAMWGVTSDDLMYTMLPLFHMGAFCTALLPSLMRGGRAEAAVAFSASGFMADVKAAAATIVVGVGPAAAALLASPPSDADRGHQVRVASFAPFPPAAQLAFEERFGVTILAEGYGQTECIPISSSSPEGPRNRATIGRPVDWLDVRVVDDEDNEVGPDVIGEIVVRPRRKHAMFAGYWNRPEDTLRTWRNLWHHTGDYGRLDADGYLHFVDRKQDSMRRRGENISSVELELAIAKHPAVAEVCVHAVPSDLGEDDVKACLVLKPDSELDPEDLFAFFERELPYFAVPRYVEAIERLPRTPTGRVQKHELRALGITATTVDLEARGLVVAKDRRRG
jgi:crotonobetaine/carnitine-CoA ligase